MVDAKIANVPIQPGQKFETDDTDINSKDIPYLQLIGTLIYVSTMTRPDVSFAVSKLSRYMNCYTRIHWKMAKNILRYLKNTSKFGIIYKFGDTITLTTYTDSDYAGDELTRKSTTGICCFIGESVVSWLSQRQPYVSLSTTESEYGSSNSGTTESIWLRRFLDEL